MPFPENQVMSYFHAFILLLIAICLAVVYVIILHQEYLYSVITPACQVLSSHIGCVPQQLNSRQNVKFCRYCIKYSLGSPMLFSVHLTIIIANMVINQAGSYYIITNLPYVASYILFLR